VPRTRIKICGLTRPQDAAAAVSSGADAVGVILAPSKRRVTLEQAVVVFAEVPRSVARVGVFADAQADDVWEAVARLGLAAVQFHGDESPETCESAPAPVIKALRVGPGFDGADVDRYRGAVAALLLDTYVAGEQGGTGMAFDWVVSRAYCRRTSASFWPEGSGPATSLRLCGRCVRTPWTSAAVSSGHRVSRTAPRSPRSATRCVLLTGRSGQDEACTRRTGDGRVDGTPGKRATGRRVSQES